MDETAELLKYAQIGLQAEKERIELLLERLRLASEAPPAKRGRPAAQRASQVRSPRAGTGKRSATAEEVADWARAHDGVFVMPEFKAAHPGTQCRILANMVRSGQLKKSKKKGVFSLPAKAATA